MHFFNLFVMMTFFSTTATNRKEIIEWLTATIMHIIMIMQWIATGTTNKLNTNNDSKENEIQGVWKLKQKNLKTGPTRSKTGPTRSKPEKLKDMKIVKWRKKQRKSGKLNTTEWRPRWRHRSRNKLRRVLWKMDHEDRKMENLKEPDNRNGELSENWKEKMEITD